MTARSNLLRGPQEIGDHGSILDTINRLSNTMDRRMETTTSLSLQRIGNVYEDVLAVRLNP